MPSPCLLYLIVATWPLSFWNPIIFTEIREPVSMVVSFTITIAYRTEKAMAPHSDTLAWKIPWTEKPGRLQSIGSKRVGHN